MGTTRRMTEAAAIPVLINRSGGTAAGMGEALADTVSVACAVAGFAIDLRLVDGADMAAAAAAVAGKPRVVVGGGDGTLGTAAAALVGGGSAMGILPLGTRNHLARDLGIPFDLDGAARLIADAPTRTIDLGRLGAGGEERVFVNNASIGLYPALVRRREENPAPKWAGCAACRAGCVGAAAASPLAADPRWGRTADGDAVAIRGQ